MQKEMKKIKRFSKDILSILDTIFQFNNKINKELKTELLTSLHKVTSILDNLDNEKLFQIKSEIDLYESKSNSDSELNNYISKSKIRTTSFNIEKNADQKDNNIEDMSIAEMRN